MPIELRLLRCAIALAEHKNFARAALACQVSQPTLSRNIQDIERRVGTQLFERGSRSVDPTDAGKIFLDQARDVVARSGDLGREMDLLRGLEKGELKIGAGTYPSAILVEKTIVKIVRDHPEVRLYIQIDNRENLLPRLKKRELDIAVIIVDGMSEESDLNITRMNRHQGYVVVRREHPVVTSKKEPTLQSLLQFPVVMSSRLPSTMLKRFLANTFGDKPIPSTAKSFPTVACESVAMMKAVILETNAFTVLPLSAVKAEIQSRQLTVLPLVVPWFQAEFAVVRLAHRSLSPVGETFVRMLQEEDAAVLDSERGVGAELFAKPKRRAKPASTAR
jgi:DNA-binding transcriptional LysR family regulator